MELYFRFGTDTLATGEDRAMLLTAGRLAGLLTGARVTVEGHTDQMGSDRYNIRLGLKRASQVLKGLSLWEKKGKVAVKSYGKRKLKCPGDDEECRSLNRRAVLRIEPR